jgi:hypothetical protein
MGFYHNLIINLQQFNLLKRVIMRQKGGYLRQLLIKCHKNENSIVYDIHYMKITMYICPIKNEENFYPG